jgi:hypothetical protein
LHRVDLEVLIWTSFNLYNPLILCDKDCTAIFSLLIGIKWNLKILLHCKTMDPGRQTYRSWGLYLWKLENTYHNSDFCEAHLPFHYWFWWKYILQPKVPQVLKLHWAWAFICTNMILYLKMMLYNIYCGIPFAVSWEDF